MTTLSAFAAALLLLVSITLPNGRKAPAKHIRQLGGETYVEMIATLTKRAAREEGVSEYDLGALLVDESTLGLRDLSFNGSSRTLGQLNTSGKYYAAYENACRAVPSECTYASIRVAAWALHEAQSECGKGPAGFGRYRSRHCLHRRREDATYRKARVLQRTSPTLLAM